MPKLHTMNPGCSCMLSVCERPKKWLHQVLLLQNGSFAMAALPGDRMAIMRC